jgi:hypothetical protein
MAVGGAVLLGTFVALPVPAAHAHHYPMTGVSVTADGQGYAIVSEAGEVYAYGSVVYRGNPTGFTGKIVDISVTADGRGYVAISSAGQVYAYGTAVYRGNPTGFTGSIVDISLTANGQGYVAMSSTGQVYAYNVPYRGNPTGFTGSMTGIALRPDGQGYVAISSAGQVYAYNVVYRGNPTGFTGSMVDIGVTNSGAGYVAISSSGQVYAFNVTYRGNVSGYSGSIAGVSVRPDGGGYIAVASHGQAPANPFGGIIWQHQHAHVYAYWNMAVVGDTWNIDQNIQVLQRARDSYWAGSWTWNVPRETSEGGYAGIQTNGGRFDGSTGDTAIFSIWRANGSRGPACGAFGGEGTGLSCRRAYTINTNRLYRLRIWRLNADSSGQWWGAWILDQSTGVETWIGDLRAPHGVTSMTGYQNFAEYFGRQMLQASYVPRSIVDFTQPAANYTGAGGIYASVGSYAGGYVGPGTTGSVQPVNYGWTVAARVTQGG